MAKIVKCSVPWSFDYRSGADYRAAYAKYEADVAAAYKKPGDPLAGKIFSSPVCDGYACYVIVSSRPLVLAHMEAGDAYRLQPYAERGLRLDDIKRTFAFEEIWTKAAAKA